FIRAVSGRDGKRLWGSADFRTEFLATLHLAGDSEPRVILILGKLSQGQNQIGLAVLSGRDGTTRWQKVLSDLTDRAFRNVPFFPNESFPVEAADLNGDGVEDLVVFAVGRGEVLRAVALDGTTGATLWEHDVPGKVDQQVPAPGLAITPRDPDGEVTVFAA